MAQYFAYDYTGEPFHLFGPGHFIALGIFLAINLYLIYGWKNPSEQAKKRIRLVLAIVLVVAEGSWHLWNIYWGAWTIKDMLPLHLCAVLVNIGFIMLFTKNHTLYEFIYFLGIGGAMQALLTPEAGIYGFPHFRLLQTLTAHGAVVTAGVYMTVIEGYRPTWRSLVKVAIWTKVYMAVVYVINLILGSNYLFIMHKPETASLIEVLGPWPWYILSLEAVGLVVALLLYLPFAIKDWRAGKTAAAA